ncbi:MAG: KH domain-containing protein [Candidatus Pacearchaeota archaeon]
MTKILYVKSARKIIQNKRELEDKLKVVISVKGINTIIDSEKEIDEYFASRVIQAMDFPFLIDDALMLKSEDFSFKVINIKDYTRRHDMKVIKGRIIGTKGKTLRVLSDLTRCEFALKDNEVAIIGRVEDVQKAEQAIISLIRGSKQGNVYAYLEGLNRVRRKEKNKDKFI